MNTGFLFEEFKENEKPIGGGEATQRLRTRPKR